MRTILILLLGLFPAVAPAQECPAEKELRTTAITYFDKKAKIQADYRKKLAELLLLGEKVEIYLLDFETRETPHDEVFWENRLEKDEFPITPYGAKSKILQTRTLTDAQRREFLPILQATVGASGDLGSGAMCHFPINGVRIYAGDSILFQTSFCWECHNFGVDYPDGSDWVGVYDPKMQKAFEKLLPIPPAEIERFQQKYGSKKKPEPVSPAIHP